MTPEGERLYEFIRPFFGGIDSLAGEIQAGASQFIRLGASGPVLRHHLPAVLQRLRKTMPRLRLSLLDATAPQLIQSLKRDELDLAVTTLDETPAHGLTARPLVQLPLTLLVPRASRVRSVKELWKREAIDEPLISLPAHEPIAAHFQRGLQKLGVDWPPTLVVSSLELIETYVAKGFGFGATVFVPGVREPAGVRSLPVEEFESLSVGALWAGRQTELIGTLVSAFETYVREFDGG
jgi:DNA-binding transcriptional LysR family regulator